MINHHKIKTKSGLASFYVITFVTLVLSIIVMSFVRVVMIDSARTTNDDLYQSAYDSAIAGVEDARVALTKYQKCKTNNSAYSDCTNIINTLEKGADNCDAVSTALGRTTSGEVNIVETTNTNDENSSSLDQAYTCVTVDLSVDDYRGTLSSGNRIQIIPIRVPAGTNVASITNIQVSWFSDAVKEDGVTYSTFSSDTFPNSVSAGSKFPVMTVDVFQTGPAFTLGEQSVNNGTNADHLSVTLIPTAVGGSITSVTKEKLAELNNKFNNTAQGVDCGSGGEFKCNANIGIPGPYSGARNSETFFLRLESPYGIPTTDYSIKLFAGNTQVPFAGVQAAVDSTGRANDLVRRVETRIDFMNDFPYPEFSAQINTDSAGTLQKNIAVAKNCWSADSGTVSDCSAANGGGADGFDAFK